MKIGRNLSNSLLRSEVFDRATVSLQSGYSIVRRRIKFPVIVLGAGLLLVQPCAGAPFEFEETGSLAAARLNHTATLLSNGKVLVAGGFNYESYLASAELYTSDGVADSLW